MKEQYVSDLIQEFLQHVEIEMGRSINTVRNYELYLNRFYELASEGLDREMLPSDITEEVLRKYRLRLNRYETDENGHRLTTVTQGYYLIALRGFLKYLARRGINSLDPALVDLPKTHRPQVTFLHLDEIQAMLEQIDLDTETGLRDRAIIELLFLAACAFPNFASLTEAILTYRAASLSFVVRAARTARFLSTTRQQSASRII